MVMQVTNATFATILYTGDTGTLAADYATTKELTSQNGCH